MDAHALDAADTTILFADLQEGIVNVGVTADVARLRRAVSALAELAGIFTLPVTITTVPTTSGAVAPILGELLAKFPGTPGHLRTTAGAFDDPTLVSAIEASGRKTLIVAGVATEVAVALAAAGAQRAGFRVVIAVDACGGLDARSEFAALTTMSAQGIVLSSVPAIAALLAGDFRTENGRAAMAALQSMLAGHSHAHSRDAHDDVHDHRS